MSAANVVLGKPIVLDDAEVVRQQFLPWLED